MASGLDMTQLGAIGMVALAILAALMALFYPLLAPSPAEARLKGLLDGRAGAQRTVQRGNRRKQVQESLRKQELKQEDEVRKRKRLTLGTLIAQSGLELSIGRFWLISLSTGAILTVLPYVLGAPWYLCLLCGFVGPLGLPRWFLGMLRKRRLEKFLSDLPDALEVMVRGLKSGLPLTEALKVIASESSPPVAPEFRNVVEGQRLGITIEQGLERMYERVPLQEVNFLSIVLNIQSKTGGNLSETLNNVAKVLRDRRRMKSRIRSASQEAKSSATIIGAVPFVIMGLLAFFNPEFLRPLFTTLPGNLVLAGSAVWMLAGVLVMRKMINFDI